MFIPDLDFLPIPDPSFRGQKGTGFRIPDPQHFNNQRYLSFKLVTFQVHISKNQAYGPGIPVLVGELGEDFGRGNILTILLVVFPQQVKHCHRLGVLHRSHLQVVFDIGRSGQRTK
jgi:hypothetical protein